jgi:pimeloyl-ACP methyl ester carboxylesterase
VKTFSRDGFVFDADDRGRDDGEAIVLLHGFPENRTCWDPVVARLVDAGYRTLAPDQRGYSPGARPQEPKAYLMTELVADVLALADQAEVERFHVVGHDWGGAVAWAVAGEHADRVRTLTVLSTPHPRAFRRALVSSDQAIRSRYMAFFQLRGTAEKALLQDDGRRFVDGMARSGLDREHCREYFEFLREPEAMTGALNWYRAIRVRSSADVPSITVPTLYVWSTEDVALGREAADLTARYVKGPYRFEVLEGVSHWIPEDEPETTARLILEHLAAHAA